MYGRPVYKLKCDRYFSTNYEKAHGEAFYLSKRTPRVPPIATATTETTGRSRRRMDALKNSTKCFAFILWFRLDVRTRSQSERA